MTHLERINALRAKLASKTAFAPPPPPMDPAMMGGQPPMPTMDPTMDPAAMMGGQPPMPPMDQTTMGGQPPVDMASLQAMADQLGITGAGAQQDNDGINEKLDAIGYLLMEIAKGLNLGIGGEAGQPPPIDEEAAVPPEGGPVIEDPAAEQVLTDQAQAAIDPAAQMPADTQDEGGSYIERQLRRMRQ